MPSMQRTKLGPGAFRAPTPRGAEAPARPVVTRARAKASSEEASREEDAFSLRPTRRLPREPLHVRDARAAFARLDGVQVLPAHGPTPHAANVDERTNVVPPMRAWHDHAVFAALVLTAMMLGLGIVLRVTLPALR